MTVIQVDDQVPVEPLSGLPFEQWWMRGYQKYAPTAVMDLPAGKTITLEVSCNKQFTTYGSRTSESDGRDPLGSCPDDVGSLHSTLPAPIERHVELIRSSATLVNDKSLANSVMGASAPLRRY
jgi:hypothetical protein